MIIRSMEQADLAGVSTLEQTGIQSPWSEGMLTSQLKLAGSLQLVAGENEQIFGYVASRIIGTEAELLRLVVSPAYRRRGLGSSLMKSFFKNLAQRAVRECHLESRRSNHAALALYEKFGFQIVGVRRHYYDNPVEDGLLMCKTFSDQSMNPGE